MDKHEEDTAVTTPGSASKEEVTEPGPVPSSTEDLHAGLEALEAELAAEREQHLRAVAELENVRRRAAREVENAHKYGIERLAGELLTVKDTMEMGLQAATDSDSGSAMAQGFQATLKLLDQCLAKFGISEVNPEDEPFDPELHEAMAAQPSESHEPGTVLMVVQKGYRIHDRLLRPARVIVARAADDENSP
ncbi:MAG: nucleotide exchange factor GrpE [Gammaproteobacteria bacterium]|jgi:molecular chaperone GrpE